MIKVVGDVILEYHSQPLDGRESIHLTVDKAYILSSSYLFMWLCRDGASSCVSIGWWRDDFLWLVENYSADDRRLFVHFWLFGLIFISKARPKLTNESFLYQISPKMWNDGKTQISPNVKDSGELQIDLIISWIAQIWTATWVEKRYVRGEWWVVSGDRVMWLWSSITKRKDDIRKFHWSGLVTEDTNIL